MRTFRSSAHLIGGAMVVAFSVVSSACDTRTESPSHSTDDDPVQQTVAWRAKHEADYTRDWSTIAGLHILHQGAQTAGSASTNDIVLPPSVPAVV